MPTKSQPRSDAQSLSQIDKFKEAARDLETDDREEAFDAKLKRVAKAQHLTGEKRRPKTL